YNNGEKFKTTESMAILKGRVALKPVRATSIIEITVYSPSAQEAAELANKVAEVYRQHRLEKGKSQVGNAIDTLKGQFEEQDKKVADIQAEVDRLRRELNISDLD